MEHIHVLHKTLQGVNRQMNREPDLKDESDLCLGAMPDVFSDCDIVAEFAGDALATLEDWERELTLDDLNAGRTEIH
jgi:hypothetical protein